MEDRYNVFLNGLQAVYNSYIQMLKEAKRLESMTPKEYGMSLKKRRKKRK